MSVAAPDDSAGDDRHALRWPLLGMALLLAALGLVPTANLLTGGAAYPQWSRHVRQWSAWLAISTVLAITIARLGGIVLGRAITSADRLLLAPSPRRFAWLAGAATACLSLAVGTAAFGLHPVSADELAQLWQAQLLASGHLTARASTHPEFFSTLMTVEAGGRWFSQFPIGGPAILALGVAARVPWLINPLLTGWTAVVLHRFVAATDDVRTARLATVLFALSPFVLLMGGSEMNNVPVLACVMTALAALPRWAKAADGASARPAASIIGLALGVAATCRPYDAVLVAVPIVLFQLATLRQRPALVRSMTWQGGAGAIPVILLLAANRATTGAPLLFGYDLLNGAAHRPGFHASPLGAEHTPIVGLRVASSYLMSLDTSLLAWPVPAVLLMVLALVLQRRASRWDLLLAGIFVMLLAGYAAYWAESYFAGPRFLYCAVPVFVLLVARLPLLLRERLRSTRARTAATLLLPIWLVLAWTLPPNRAHGYGVRTVVRLNAEKRTNGAAVARRANEAGLHNALVFVPDGWHERLAARLRLAGVRPLQAAMVAAHADACVLQTTLDALDASSDRTSERSRANFIAVLSDTNARALPNQRPSDQISLTPNRPLTATCARELSRADSYGVSFAELLPLMSVDASGRLAGDVVFARDLDGANERLRDEFGARQWYVADVAPARPGVTVRFRRVPPPRLTAALRPFVQAVSPPRTAPSDPPSPPR